MGKILAMPELWIGLGLVLAMVYLLLGNRTKTKRMNARLARATRGRHRTQAAQIEQSLRRKHPGEASVLGQRIAGFSMTTKLRGRLEMAGLSITPPNLLMVAVGLFLAVFFIVSIVLEKKLLIGLLLGLLVGLGLPHMAIRRKMRKRQKVFLKLFPEGIDLIVRGLRAGLPVAESFLVVSREIPAPVGDMFATMSQQMQLGLPMEKALIEAAVKIDLTEFDFFVTTIVLQRETGGNLGEILSNLSDTLRQRQMMGLKISALSSEARASAIIIGSLPFLVFAMLSFISPKYLEPFYTDYRGNLAALGALGIISVGALIMRKMTQLEI